MDFRRAEQSESMDTYAFPTEKIIRPTLHHFGLTTGNLEPLRDWYSKVLGMWPVHESAKPLGEETPPGLKALWLTNDRANHRIRILCLPGLEGDPERARHHRLQHVAFEYPTLDDLLSTYARLKAVGIEPVRTADQGTTTSFYYLDPDGNCIELLADNFGDWEMSGEYMRNSAKFAANPMGTFIDADKMIAARQAGTSSEELHRRANAGEFPPSNAVDPMFTNESCEDL